MTAWMEKIQNLGQDLENDSEAPTQLRIVGRILSNAIHYAAKDGLQKSGEFWEYLASEVGYFDGTISVTDRFQLPNDACKEGARKGVQIALNFLEAGFLKVS